LYAAISAWRSGHSQTIDFSANSFAGIYASHIAQLARIRHENPRGYHLLKAKLYEEVMYAILSVVILRKTSSDSLGRAMAMASGPGLEDDIIDVHDIAVD
jgi:hypothetical protein